MILDGGVAVEMKIAMIEMMMIVFELYELLVRSNVGEAAHRNRVLAGNKIELIE